MVAPTVALRRSKVGRWIRFQYIAPSKSGKTDIYQVIANQGDIPLGVVKWQGSWRKYAFFPYAETLFEQDCLRDIAKTLDELTEEWRKRFEPTVNELSESVGVGRRFA